MTACAHSRPSRPGKYAPAMITGTPTTQELIDG